MVKTRAMKGGCLTGLAKSKKGGCKVGKKRATGTYADADFKRTKKGRTHVMPDGTIMSGATHSKSSRRVAKKAKGKKRKLYGY